MAEFLQGNQVQLAWVLEESSGKLRLVTLHKREVKMPASRLLPWTGPMHDASASREEIQHALEEHAARRAEIESSVDVAELWELAQGEVDQAETLWFAQLAWQDPDPDQVAAIGRLLLAAKTRFKFQPPAFLVHPADKVEILETRQAEDLWRERVITAGQDLFKSLWSGKGEPRGLDMDEEVRGRLRELLKDQVAGRGDEKTARLWAQLKKGLPEHPHQALLLAQAWGVLPPHHDPLMDQIGYDRGDDWSEAFHDEIDGHLARFEEARQEPEDLDLVSIDAPTTLDIDDAFHVRRDGGNFRLTLALARPDLAWEFDSPLDEAVRRRASSLYLPEGVSHMLPQALGLERYSLTAGQDRPALLAEFTVGPDGRMASVTPRPGWVRVRENTTYQAVEQALESGREPFATARDLAARLQKARVEDGAAVILRPDPEVRLTGEGAETRVEMGLKPSCPGAELMVSEFMILGNAGLAAWAREQGLPMLHRVQKANLPPEASGVFEHPADVFNLVRLLPPPLLEIDPAGHAALGADAYTPVTSPVRRYVDLVNSAQVCSLLATGKPRFDRAGLSAMLPTISARTQAVAQVQRYRPRYWKLLFLKQQAAPQRAMLLEDQGPYPTLAIPELQINLRAPRKILGDKLHPGQIFELTFGRIDPLANEIKVIEAIEA